MSRSVVRKIAIYVLYIVLAVLLQTSWPAALAIAGVRPDLALILAAVSGLLFGAKEGAIVGLCCGFLLDAQAGRLIGLGMLLLMLAGVVPVLLLRSMPQRPLLLAPAAAAAGTLIFHAAVFGVSWVFPTLSDLSRNPYELKQVVVQVLIPLVILNAALALPLALLMRYAGPQRRKSMDVIE